VARSQKDGADDPGNAQPDRLHQVLHGQRERAPERQQPAGSRSISCALSTLPEVQIIYGHFLAKIIRRPLVNPIPGLPRTVDVHTSEEKGSDVNLAVHLVHDAWAAKFDVAVVVSNDSDLEAPIRIVKDELRKPLGSCAHTTAIHPLSSRQRRRLCATSGTLTYARASSRR